MKKTLVLLLGLTLSLLNTQCTQAQTYADFSGVAAKTIDGVVHIRTEQTRLTPLYQSFFGFIINQGVQRQVYSAYGSGVVISADGYIVTNNHVVQDAERISVTLNDRRVLPAKLVGNDPATDLAVIKIDASGLVPIPFGNSDSARVGQPVLAIGNPFNLTSTVTAGIISAKARNMGIIDNTRTGDTPLEAFIQTDAAVNPGNSGGALVDGNARLIGIVTAIASPDGYYNGYSFAIPSSIARKVSYDLKEYGHVQRAYLGVNVVELTSDYARKMGLSEVRGVVIARAPMGGAAAKAGLREGDIIIAVGENTVNSYAEMMEEAGRYYPGDHVVVTFLRDNQVQSATLTLQNARGTTELIRNK